MKIALDAIGIHYEGGGRSSVLNLLHHLFKMDAENKYLVFLTEYEPTLETPSGNVRQVVLPVKNRFLVRLYAQLVMPFKTRGYDLVHFMKNLGVFGMPLPSVVTIHDMTTILYPKTSPLFDYLYWLTVERLTVRNARRIITVSKNAARDLETVYHVPPQKIRVIYHGCEEIFMPSTAEEIARIRQKYKLPDSYILHVGRLDVKKNLTTLVKAFHRLREKGGYSGKLVFVGEEYKKWPDLTLRPTVEALGLADEVIFTGRVPSLDLPALFSGAELFVFPSFHEGFGLVVLEAMTCGAPVIAHQAGAVSEVLGDAGLILPEVEPEGLADQIALLVDHPEIREEYRLRGLERAKQFNWDKAAEQVLNVYREVSLGKK